MKEKILLLILFCLVSITTVQSDVLTLERSDGSTFTMSGKLKYYKDNEFIIVSDSGGEQTLLLEQVRAITFSKVGAFDDRLILQKSDSASDIFNGRIKQYEDGKFIVTSTLGKEVAFPVKQVQMVEFGKIKGKEVKRLQSRESPSKTLTKARVGTQKKHAKASSTEEKTTKSSSVADTKPQAEPPAPQVPETKGPPDGLVERRYSLVIVPKDAVPPYKLTLLSGTLPPGLTINERIGGIEGEPKQAGEWKLKISIIDAKDKKETFEESIRVWKRFLTVGKNGTFKGFDGMQMAINMAQNFDEIRIQAGIYKGTGLVIPKNKKWENGIKISGGWGNKFSERKGETILDGGKKKNSILTISNKSGKVFLETLTFRNGKGAVKVDSYEGQVFFTSCSFSSSYSDTGGAVDINTYYSKGVVFTNCSFENNSSYTHGGAVFSGRRKNVAFNNCIFRNNTAGSSGGAVGWCFGPFTNCIFENNSASNGGAVSNPYGGDFKHCTFVNNSASSGGAVTGGGTFNNCSFYNNSAKGEFSKGGAVCVTRKSTFINSVFFGNSTGTYGGAIYGDGFFLCSSLFYGNSASSGGAILSNGNSQVTNCTFYSNKANEKGGTIMYKEGSSNNKIINSIFYKNLAGENHNDIESEGNLDIDYCLINHLKGAANFGPHNVMGDPKFVDPENGNFQLRSDSPCTDKGNNEDVEKLIARHKEASLCLASNKRILGEKVDLGAYEWREKTISLLFGTKEFPEGLVGEQYSFVVVPKYFAAPYKVKFLSGTLPSGITINEQTGEIGGVPKQPGEWKIILSISDAKGKRGNFMGTIRISRILTVGEDGTFKGFDGIQQAIGTAQDFDEIRIQSGIYKGTGLIIPENKEWDYGIKISGGWDSGFLNRKGNTILDGEKKKDIILTISNKKGKVSFENLVFTNSKGGAIKVEVAYKRIFFTDCSFANNSSIDGGAIEGEGIFTNCSFDNNSASYWGGAIRANIGVFTNCTFTNNSACNGGAVSGKGNFNHCTFINNSANARLSGGAGGSVCGSGNFINCNFINNSADRGGSVYVYATDTIFINCVFGKNSAKGDGGGCNDGGFDASFVNCLFYENSASSGGAIVTRDKIINCTFFNNKAKEKGGAIMYGRRSNGKTINSIFYKNIARGENNDIEIRAGNSLDIDYCLINHLKGAANFGSYNITGDPKFVDAENGDFSLRVDSPCIDKGSDEDIKKIIEKFKEASMDLAGSQRIVGEKVDLGAYECVRQ